ncbi:MAG: flavodoxin FldA [Paludibacteraceae bacterium]|nr:flavodoxin FldA [Paludibacteraceae bacterium]MBP5136890.1 flavodoxin FldA [Paludibacteraceae bacterium]MBP5742220.1 flavodoxin FldA [Paludibacteraceae bacterium]
MEKVGIFFGTSTGNTEAAAERIASAIGDAELKNVSEGVSEADFEAYDNIILGTSTWGVGDLQDDWDSAIGTLQKANLSGKVVALFGLGDSSSYSDTFVNGIALLYNAIKDKGATIVGAVDASDYTYDDSEAVQDGKFIGLALDEDNESSKSDIRIEAWVANLKNSFK